MRRFTLAAGAACAVILTGHAGAQFTVTGGNATTGTGAGMPGQAVSSYRGNVTPVGQRAPAAAPAAGMPVTGSGAMQRPYDPTRPYDALAGTGLDAGNLVAPLVGPDGKPVQPPDALDRLSDQIRAVFGLLKPNPPRPAYTPGITRRAKERGQMMWRRD